MKEKALRSAEPFRSEWAASPVDLYMRKNEIHVWCCSLDQPSHIIESLTATLTDDEVKRAERFTFQNGRLNFIVSRGVLRVILASYLRLDPKDIRFSYGRQGKPSLSGKMDAHLCFNVSHSRNIALYAFAYDLKVGVDIEYISGDRTFRDLAGRFFSRREVSALNSLPEDAQRNAFFKFWTCKEAFLKAIGTGLSFGLDKVEIDITTGAGPVFSSINGDAVEAASWTLQSLDVASGYAAALVTDSPAMDMKCWKWDNGLS